MFFPVTLEHRGDCFHLILRKKKKKEGRNISISIGKWHGNKKKNVVQETRSGDNKKKAREEKEGHHARFLETGGEPTSRITI